jgi:hypothetical protein
MASASREALAYVESFLQQPEGALFGGRYRPAVPRDLLKRELAFQHEVLRACLQCRVTLASGEQCGWVHLQALRLLVRELLGVTLPSADELVMVARVTSDGSFVMRNELAGNVLKAVDRFANEHGFTPELRDTVAELARSLDRDQAEALAAMAAATRNQASAERAAPQRNPGPLAILAWSDFFARTLERIDLTQRSQWRALLLHAGALGQVKPTRKWTQAMKPILDEVGHSAARSNLLDWFENATRFEGGTSLLMCDRNAETIRGLAFFVPLLGSTELVRALGNVGEVAFKKVPWWGPVCKKVGNACVAALAEIEESEAVAQLGRLKVKVKNPTALLRVDRAFELKQESTGLSAEELEDLSVPTFGLDESATLRQQFGEHVAVLAVTPRSEVELNWQDAAGRPLRSVPSAIRQNHGPELKTLKRTAKDLEAMLPAQRLRLERELIAARAWSHLVWSQRLLQQPVLSSLVRRLIWRFERSGEVSLAIPQGGSLVGVTGNAIDVDGASVRLWHPLDATAGTVAAWRTFLEERRIVQPFKQAHREIYVLTDAERVTTTYSNRFAHHILRQHQLQALCRQRGWRYELQGGFDRPSTPTVEFRRLGLRAELWVESIDEGDVSGAGIFLRVATDQVRFADMGGAPIALANVPPLVLSEVMRDVDLLVSVSSIGVDPALGQREHAHRAYWSQYAFGELSDSAQQRRALIERLLPRLRIASRCTVVAVHREGKFSRRERQTTHLQDPLGQREHTDPTERSIPVHRFGSSATGERAPLPTVRAGSDSLAHLEQSGLAGGRRQDQGPADPLSNPARLIDCGWPGRCEVHHRKPPVGTRQSATAGCLGFQVIEGSRLALN